MNLFKLGKIMLSTVYLAFISVWILSISNLGICFNTIIFSVVTVVTLVSSTLLVRFYGTLVIGADFQDDVVTFIRYNKKNATENVNDCIRIKHKNGTLLLTFNNGNRYFVFKSGGIMKSKINNADFDKNTFQNAEID